MTIKKKLKVRKAINKISDSLGGIIRKRALLHRTKFTGNYSYDDICEKLGRKPVIDGKYAKLAKRDQYFYTQSAFTKLKGGTLKFLLNPRDPFRPSTIIETSNSTPKFLFYLNQNFPNLKIFSIEYTIDFYCKDPESVSNLFRLLRRYMFFPAAKSTSMVGGQFYAQKPKKENSVYSIHFTANKTNPGKYIKIYERGHDEKAEKPRPSTSSKWWKQENINRVRLEFTISRKNNLLKRKGLRKLSDLLDNPQFEAICFPHTHERYDQIQFKHFIPPRINRHRGSLAAELPAQWEDYTATDKNGNPECFQEEFLHAKRNEINPSNYTVHTEALRDFKKKTRKTLKNFENMWTRRVKKFRKNTKKSN